MAGAAGRGKGPLDRGPVTAQRPFPPRPAIDEGVALHPRHRARPHLPRRDIVELRDHGIVAVALHDGLLEVLVDRRLRGREEARAELSTAVTMLREMEMIFWLPDAEDELARVEL